MRSVLALSCKNNITIRLLAIGRNATVIDYYIEARRLNAKGIETQFCAVPCVDSSWVLERTPYCAGKGVLPFTPRNVPVVNKGRIPYNV